MAQGMENSRIRREYSHFFLNYTEISGIQSCGLDFQSPVVPISHIGLTNPIVSTNGVRRGSCSISYIPLHADQFLFYTTGNSGFAGHLLPSQTDTGNGYSFTSAYVTSYSSRCSIDSLPEIEVNLDILGNLGRLDSSTSEIISNWNGITGQTGVAQHKLASFASIDLLFDGIENNRVINYDLNISTERNPVYPLNTSIPSFVDINYPISVVLNLSLDVNDYAPSALQDYPCKSRVNNLVLALKDHQTYEEYLRYSFNDLILVGQNYTTNTNGNVNLNLQYKTYIGRPTGATLAEIEECTTSTTTEGCNNTGIWENFCCPDAGNYQEEDLCLRYSYLNYNTPGGTIDILSGFKSYFEYKYDNERCELTTGCECESSHCQPKKIRSAYGWDQTCLYKIQDPIDPDYIWGYLTFYHYMNTKERVKFVDNLGVSKYYSTSKYVLKNVGWFTEYEEIYPPVGNISNGDFNTSFDNPWSGVSPCIQDIAKNNFTGSCCGQRICRTQPFWVKSPDGCVVNFCVLLPIEIECSGCPVEPNCGVGYTVHTIDPCPGDPDNVCPWFLCCPDGETPIWNPNYDDVSHEGCYICDGIVTTTTTTTPGTTTTTPTTNYQ